MKRQLTLLLFLVLSLSLCACGTESPAQTTAAPAQTEAVESETTEAVVYAENFIVLEEVVYDDVWVKGPILKLKLRNITDERIGELVFRVQTLDNNGDVLEASWCAIQDGLDAGQAYYFGYSPSALDKCETPEEVRETAGAIRIISIEARAKKGDYDSGVEYEFKEPLIWQIADVKFEE